MSELLCCCDAGPRSQLSVSKRNDRRARTAGLMQHRVMMISAVRGRSGSFVHGDKSSANAVGRTG